MIMEYMDIAISLAKKAIYENNRISFEYQDANNISIEIKMIDIDDIPVCFVSFEDFGNELNYIIGYLIQYFHAQAIFVFYSKDSNIEYYLETKQAFCMFFSNDDTTYQSKSHFYTYTSNTGSFKKVKSQIEYHLDTTII